MAGGAFAQGFNIGRSVYQQALDNQDREQRRAADEKERQLRMEAAQLGIDAQRTAAARESQLATLRQGISDLASGTDRGATNAALDADFSRALAASDAAVMDENAQRQGVAVAAPAMPAMPAVQGGSNAANEAALTVRKPVDPSSTQYRADMNRLQAQYATTAGQMDVLRALDAESRTIKDDALFAGRLKEYAGTPEQIGQSRVFLNQNSQRITMGSPDKNGLVRVSVVTPDGEAEFLKLSRADQAKLYAAAGLMETNPVRALEVMGSVNKTLAEAVAADNNMTGLLVTNANDVASKGQTMELARKADTRADAQDRRLNAAEGRAAAEAKEKKEEAKSRSDAAVALYKETNPTATPAQIEAVRSGVIAAVPKVDTNAPSEVKLANAALAAKVPGVTTMAEALTWARTRVNKSPEEVRAEIYKAAMTQPGSTAERARRTTEDAMKFLYPASPAPAAAPAPAAGGQREVSGRVTPPPKPATQAEAHDQARAALARGASKEAVNARLRQMQYEPLP